MLWCSLLEVAMQFYYCIFMLLPLQTFMMTKSALNCSVQSKTFNILEDNLMYTIQIQITKKKAYKLILLLTPGTKWFKGQKYMRQTMHLYRKFQVWELEHRHKPSQANNLIQRGKCSVEHTEALLTLQELCFPSSSFQIRNKQIIPWPYKTLR